MASTKVESIFSDANSSVTGISSVDIDFIDDMLKGANINMEASATQFIFRGNAQPSVPVLAKACTVCQEEADLTCAGCKNTPSHENTSYCSVECQKTDWKNHMPECKLLKAKKGLFRAGDLMQELWYAHRELSFDKDIVKLENKGNVIYLYEGGGQKTFYKFPSEICGTEAEKNAVLSFLGSMEAVAAFDHSLPDCSRVRTQNSFRPFILTTTNTLADIITHVEEVSVVPIENGGPDIITIDTDGTEHRDMATTLHEVWKVTTVGSERYYIDLTGAQYGFCKTIIPEMEFEELHAAKIIYYDDKKLGRNQRNLDGLCTGVVGDTPASILKPTLCECINQCISQWEKNSDVTARKLVLMPDNGFRKTGFRFNREYFRIAVEESFRMGSNLCKEGLLSLGEFEIDAEGSGEETRLKFVDKSWATGISGEDLRARSAMWPVGRPLPAEVLAMIPPFLRPQV